MGRLRRSRTHKGIKDISKKYRLKRKTKDLDQIQQDLLPESKEKLEKQELDADLPGEGQYYCIECNKYFIDSDANLKHKVSKVHKRRLRQLKVPAYTQKESEFSAGMGSTSVLGNTQQSSLIMLKRKNDAKKAQSNKMSID
ncbi:Zinc finger protein [Smittium culicis]|uniref:Zinc finger protein n=2 Tax=Smittium culicis TaxID=133412 RepID=A0A1R1X033_9FUNG|nr:Zinc finger protein [Smittium culicis]OMJ13833.1 Zinc finger protein [Smittium culicis]OMJ20293.1 Zinc finger protein [Smittium culicis]